MFPPALLYCLFAVHANGAREYDVHNLYGTAMALEHHAAVEKITGKRPFLLTR
jgi:alpha-glucosidase (family GH31 glycosyl hydrolase)